MDWEWELEVTAHIISLETLRGSWKWTGPIIPSISVDGLFSSYTAIRQELNPQQRLFTWSPWQVIHVCCWKNATLIWFWHHAIVHKDELPVSNGQNSISRYSFVRKKMLIFSVSVFKIQMPTSKQSLVIKSSGPQPDEEPQILDLSSSSETT